LWDLRFSQRWPRKIPFIGMWRRVDTQKKNLTLSADFSLDFHFDAEDWGRTFLRNVGNLLGYRGSHPEDGTLHTYFMIQWETHLSKILPGYHKCHYQVRRNMLHMSAWLCCEPAKSQLTDEILNLKNSKHSTEGRLSWALIVTEAGSPPVCSEMHLYNLTARESESQAWRLLGTTLAVTMRN
jgi:hypothetical protein